MRNLRNFALLVVAMSIVYFVYILVLDLSGQEDETTIAVVRNNGSIVVVHPDGRVEETGLEDAELIGFNGEQILYRHLATDVIVLISRNEKKFIHVNDNEFLTFLSGELNEDFIEIRYRDLGNNQIHVLLITLTGDVMDEIIYDIDTKSIRNKDGEIIFEDNTQGDVEMYFSPSR